MRPSRVLDKLRSGGVAICTKMNLGDPAVIEIAGLFGFDCAWLDAEHVPGDYGQLRAQILAAKAAGLDAMVRVARGGYSDYIKPLELDASGIMVPHLMGIEDARTVVRTTRFHPIGRRPVDGGNADGAYCNLEFTSYLEQANRNRFVMVQIEDPEPVDELDEIAALDGIDVLFFGPGDFSHGIGAPGQSDHPKLLEARKRVAEAALRHGRFAGTVGAPDKIEELVEMGYRVICTGADVVGLGRYYRSLMEDIAKLTLPTA